MASTGADQNASRRPSRTRRIAAATALAVGVLTVALVVFTVAHDLIAGILALVGLSIVVATVWQATLRAGIARRLLLVVAVVEVVLVLAELAAAGLLTTAVLVLLAVVLTVVAIVTAFGRFTPAGGRWRPVPAAARPVLLINPRSGGGRAERAGLAEAARVRGIETIVLAPGDDLAELARRAIENGADVLGMAGGDGSMALVASLVAQHDLTFVCLPAGTRNHLALDLGVRREDLIGGLDAFGEAVACRVDLASVNGRIFVNNVSLGVYAEAVQEPEYRTSKVSTIGTKVHQALGPGGVLPTIELIDDQGEPHTSAAVVMVSNNSYALDRSLGRNTRPTLDGGSLGIVLVDDRRVRSWVSTEMTISTPATAAAAMDGEAITLDPPMRFDTHPGALRVRISPSHPGLSPSARLPPRLREVGSMLADLARGRSERLTAAR